MTDYDHLPVISIVIASRNEETVIGKCLDSLKDIDYPRDRMEVIVVDDSSDSTFEIINKYNWVTAIRGSRKGPSAARNLGIKSSRGEFIAFADADCILPSNWLKLLIGEFSSPDIAGVGGIQTSPKDETDFGKTVNRVLMALGFIADYTNVKLSPGDVKHNASCNVMFRTSIIRRVGGFDETTWGGEDVELDHKIRKMGYRLRQNPNAVVGHYRPGTMKEYNRMMYNYGAAQAYLVRKHGIIRTLQLIPFILSLLMLIFFIIFFRLLIAFGIAKALLLLFLPIFIVLLLYGSLFGFGINAFLYFLLIMTIFEWHIGFYKYMILNRR